MSNALYEFRELLDDQTAAKFDELGEDVKLLYFTRRCQLCIIPIDIEQVQRCIEKGYLPVCTKDEQTLIEKIEELAPLFAELGF